MTDTLIPHTKLNWVIKFFDIFFASIALVSTLIIVLSTIFPKGFMQFSDLMQLMYPATLLLAIIGAAYWHYKERKKRFQSAKLHAWMLGILRYWLAYEISVYGFAKVLKTQFGTLYSRADIPVGNLSGFELTWNYFGYSYKLALILATLQIGGSVLLLFRRTTLLGICVLMPVMMNIVLINVFYSIAMGAFVNSLLITGGLTFLLLLKWPLLKKVFLDAIDTSAPVKLSFIKPILKILIIAGAFFTIYQYVMNDKPVDFMGKWQVEQLERNGKKIDDNAWLTDAKAWKYIYIEERGRMSLSPNPYAFDKERATFAEYHYNDTTKKFLLISDEEDKKGDTSDVILTKTGTNKMEWKMIFLKDTLKIKLVRAEPAVY